MRLLRAAKTLGLLLLFSGAFVTAAHPYQHYLTDAASLFSGDCEVCKAIAATSVNPAPVVDPVEMLFRCQPEKVAVQAFEAELPRSGSRAPPQF